LPFCFYKMHSPVANAVCLPIRWSELANGKATVPLSHWFELGDFLLNTKKKSRRVQTTRLKRQSKIMSLLAAMSRIIKISRVWVK
jgi:hypothetical protein